MNAPQTDYQDTTTSICSLCLQKKELVHSHIIPEFLYKRLYNEKHQFFVISSDQSINDRVLQKGLREYLLCQKCDGEILSSYENYTSRVLNGGESLQTTQDGNNLRIRNLNYATLRLFFISLLWRMSISKDPFFEKVSLGPHENIMRKMLLEGNPGSVDEYGVICIAPLFDKEFVGDWTLPPDCIRANGNRVYRCLISGLLYCFVVGKSSTPPLLSQCFIQPDGSWIIIRDSVEKVEFLHDWCISFGRAMSSRRMTKSTRRYP